MPKDQKASKQGVLSWRGLSGGATAIAEAKPLAATVKTIGPDAVTAPLNINGGTVTARVGPGITLVELLRNGLYLPRTKIGCDWGMFRVYPDAG